MEAIEETAHVVNKTKEFSEPVEKSSSRIKRGDAEFVAKNKVDKIIKQRCRNGTLVKSTIGLRADGFLASLNGVVYNNNHHHHFISDIPTHPYYISNIFT